MTLIVRTMVTKAVTTMPDFIDALRGALSPHGTAGVKEGDLIKIVGDDNHSDFTIGSVAIVIRVDSDGDVYAIGLKRGTSIGAAYVRPENFVPITEEDALALPFPPA